MQLLARSSIVADDTTVIRWMSDTLRTLSRWSGQSPLEDYIPSPARQRNLASILTNFNFAKLSRYFLINPEIVLTVLGEVVDIGSAQQWLEEVRGSHCNTQNLAATVFLSLLMRTNPDGYAFITRSKVV